MEIDIQTHTSAIGNPIDISHFNGEVAFLTDFYFSFFKKIKIPRISLIRLFVTNDDSVDEEITGPIGKQIPICFVTLYFDFEHYLSLNKEEKKKQILILLKTGVEKAIQYLNIDERIFDEAFSSIESLDGVYFRVVNKPQINKRNNFKAQLTCVLEPESRNYSLSLLGNNIKKNIQIVRLNNYYMGIMDDAKLLITEGEWRDDRTYVVYGKKGDYKRIIYTIDVLTEMVSIDFNLEPDIDPDRYKKEFEMATTMDKEMIDRYFSKKPLWHVYL